MEEKVSKTFIVRSQEEIIRDMSNFEVQPLEQFKTNTVGKYYPKECFHRSYLYITHVKLPGAVLVHGKYAPFLEEEPYHYFEHAWVELPGDIVFDGVLQKFYQKGAYYKYYKAENVVEYTLEEAIKMAKNNNTSGPWVYDLLFRK